MNADLLSALRLHQRRTFLTQACRGVGAVALSSLLPRAVAGAGAQQPPRGVITKPHVPPKAKRVI
ncbi:MAG TPA: sulfatase, partial [Gemmata sp.]